MRVACVGSTHVRQHVKYAVRGRPRLTAQQRAQPAARAGHGNRQARHGHPRSRLLQRLRRRDARRRRAIASPASSRTRRRRGRRRAHCRRCCNDDADGFLDAHPPIDASTRCCSATCLNTSPTRRRRCDAAWRTCAADGIVAISLPCITHGSIRAMLLDGRWDYADYGLLDRTHLRFFSREGMAALLADGGLAIVKLPGTVMPIHTAVREYGMTVRPRIHRRRRSLARRRRGPAACSSSCCWRAAAGPAHVREVAGAQPVDAARKDRGNAAPSGHRSMLQRLRQRAFMALLRGMTSAAFPRRGVTLT